MNPLKLITNLFRKKEQEAEEPEPQNEVVTEAEQYAGPVTGKGYVSKISKDGKEVYSHKYTEEQKLFIVTMIGQCRTPEEVKEAFKEKYAIELHKPGVLMRVYKNADKWKPIIERIRSKYLEDIEHVAGYHKRVRLERAERVYDRSVKKGDLKSQLSALEHQRKEVEQGNFTTLSLTLNQYNMMSSDELLAEKERLMSRLGNYDMKKIMTIKKENDNGDGRIQSEIGAEGIIEAEGQ